MILIYEHPRSHFDLSFIVKLRQGLAAYRHQLPVVFSDILDIKGQKPVPSPVAQCHVLEVLLLVCILINLNGNFNVNIFLTNFLNFEVLDLQ